MFLIKVCLVALVVITEASCLAAITKVCCLVLIKAWSLDRGPTPAFQVSKPINQDETVMYKDNDISRNDIRSMIASNIRQIEE